MIPFMMTDQAYIAAYQALINEYFDGRASMEEHLTAVQVLKDQYLGARVGVVLPVVP